MTEAETALAELTEISSQVEAAVLFDDDGQLAGSTLPDDRARLLAAAAKRLFDEAAGQVPGSELVKLEAATSDGSVFVVSAGGRFVAATTGSEPTSGLVFYDLESCLRSAAKQPKKARRRTSTKKRSGAT